MTIWWFYGIGVSIFRTNSVKPTVWTIKFSDSDCCFAPDFGVSGAGKSKRRSVREWPAVKH